MAKIAIRPIYSVHDIGHSQKKKAENDVGQDKTTIIAATPVNQVQFKNELDKATYKISRPDITISTVPLYDATHLSMQSIMILQGGRFIKF